MAYTFLQLALLAAAAASVRAESHTISFDNRCGKGTPQLIIGGAVVSNGSAYAHSGVLSSGISYLQTGNCLFNGEGCALVEFSMQNPNPAAPGSGSSADISLIAPHELNVPVAFSFYNGCDGQGKTCLTSPCVDAFYQPDDTWVQSACQTDDVDMKITFCPSGSSAPSSSSSASSSSSSAAAPSSSSAAHTSSAAAAPTTASSASSAAPSSSASAAHSAAATSASAASAPPSRATSKSCKAKAKAQAGARKRTPAKRAAAWHHRSRR